MRKILLSIACITALSGFSQTWTKISGIADSTQIKSLAAINGKIMIAGQNISSASTTDFYTSIDGNTWSKAPTFSFAGTNVWGLPQNNLLISFNKSYSANTWSAFNNTNAYPGYAEFTNGTVLGGATYASYPLYTVSPTGVAGPTLSASFRMGSRYGNGVNNRLFLFGLGLQYIDYSNLSTTVYPATLNGATITPSSWDSYLFYDIVKTSNNNLFALTGSYGIIKSTDNGVNWTNLPEFPFTSSGFSIVKNSSDDLFAIAQKTVGTGKIWKSTDGGTTFTDITGNLASNNFPKALYMNTLNELFCVVNSGGGYSPLVSGIYKFSPAVGIKENDFESSVSIYPNPTKNNFTINANTIINNVVVTDVLGKIIYSFSPKEKVVTLNLSEEKDGIYFAKIQSGTNVKTVKVIKY